MNRIVLLTHASNDLTVLHQARAQLPPGFGPVDGVNLQAREGIDLGELEGARVVIVRVLGRPGAVPGFAELVETARRQGLHLIVVSGTGEPDPELAALSTVAPGVAQMTLAYFQAGGSANLAQLLRYLSDHLLLTGHGFEPAQPLPEHGIHHPDLAPDATASDWLALRDPSRPSAGIVFYRAHWMSGNTAFVDALLAALETRGMNVLPIFTSSLRAGGGEGLPDALRWFGSAGQPHIDVLINTTSFAMGEITPGGPTPAGWSVGVLEALGVPVLQAITSGMTQDQWEISTRGMNPLDAAMNVVLPEFDGRIISVPLSFKAQAAGLSGDVVEFHPVADRVERIAGLAARFARLRALNNADKRIAFIFTNSNSKASQIGNAVGLDAPASLMRILESMRDAGYAIGDLPESGSALIHTLVDRCSYDNTYLTSEQLQHAVGRVSAERYAEWFAELPEVLQQKIEAQWGAAPGVAYVHDNHLAFAGVELGNAFVALQPPRGYGMDPDAIYHQPDLPPTHHYYGLYRWLSDEWGADAIVHVGKHGTLEWLPGKGVGLSENCFPDALLGDMPLFYPFIINDPGEGSQAKRRGHAVVVDHLTPPMTTADSYGALAQLTQLVDEYYQVEVLDPSKLPLLQQQIWELVKQTNLDSDLQMKLLHHDHDHDDEHGHHHHHGHAHGHDHDHDHHDHDHPHDHSHDGELPEALSGMGGSDVAHLIEDLDGYLCELGAAQIRDGLHILGRAPDETQMPDMLVSLTRLPNQDIPGLQEEMARLFGLKLDMLLENKGRRLNVDSALARIAGRAVVTRADAIEAIDSLCVRLMQTLQDCGYKADAIDGILQSMFGDLSIAKPRMQTASVRQPGSMLGQMKMQVRAKPLAVAPPVTIAKPATDSTDKFASLRRVLDFTCRQLLPNLHRAGDEIGNLLLGLAGGYVPAGPSGSPTRGMAHILATGRNFYSVDQRSVPSQSAWRVGQQLPREVLERHVRETGAYPESVAISIWGTSAMRTHGDDVAQILCLLGVRPVWRPGNRQVSGIEVVSLAELQRPRIDVTTRISGFFRDAFPQLIDLIDDAVNAVIALDEPLDHNFVRKHYLQELGEWIGKGLAEEQAQQRAAYR